MPRYRVEQTKVVTLVYLMRADSPRDAEDAMRVGNRDGLLDILEDDFETEYEVELVPEAHDFVKHGPDCKPRSTAKDVCHQHNKYWWQCTEPGCFLSEEGHPTDGEPE